MRILFTITAALLAAAMSTGQVSAAPAPIQQQPPPYTLRVSVSSSEAQSWWDSTNPSVSDDGRWVAFQSRDPGLAPGDGDQTWDVFVRDTLTGTTHIVSVDNQGQPLPAWAEQPSISGNGRFVAFNTIDDAVPEDTNGAAWDVYLHDRDTDQDGIFDEHGAISTVLASLANDEQAGNGSSVGGEVSDDGRFVAFQSYATNLVDGDTNGKWDVFYRDLAEDKTRRVSAGALGEGNDHSFGAKISADRSTIAFTSAATNLVGGDGNLARDVFAYDVGAKTLELVSGPGNGQSGSPSLSADGTRIAFWSYASNLVAADANGTWDVFVRDSAANTTVLVSVSTAEVQGNMAANHSPTISANGNRVAFSSRATNLVAGDTNTEDDVFVRDLSYGTTWRVSVTNGGLEANGDSTFAAISGNGVYTVFVSDASNLVSGDFNGVRDVFLRYQ